MCATRPPRDSARAAARLARAAALVLALGATPAAAQTEPAPDPPPAPAAGTTPEAPDVLPRLVDRMRDGLDRADPYVDPEVRFRLEGETFFRGHYDWHSDVHAHWALLCIGRVTEDAALVDELLARLTPEVLEAERALLAAEANAAFKLPYGQAWLLLLLDELARHEGRDSEALRAFRLETEARLLAFLAATDLDGRPLDDERVVVPNANYGCWLFGYWMLQLSRPITPGVDEALAELYAARVEPRREDLLGPREDSAYDFVHLPALLALVDRSGPPREAPAPLPAGTPLPALPEELSLRNTHVLGHELTRAWAWALAGSRGDEAAAAAFRKRLGDYLERPDTWETDYVVVSHWVPQFLWMGLWLERGRP